LPVGGVREKILAARRAGIKAVLIPSHNEKDLAELPAEVKADMVFHLIDTLDDVVPHLFPAQSRKKAQTKASPPRAKRPTAPRVLPPPEGPEKPVRRPGSV
jgi:ATP-dependent Lon protease